MTQTIKLRELLRTAEPYESPVSLPIMPGTRVTSVVAGSAKVFKSALSPFVLEFVTDAPPLAGPPARPVTCRVMFKVGDDLRQDQLIIQMIGLMDRLLKAVNLDMHLTPYRVLATG